MKIKVRFSKYLGFVNSIFTPFKKRFINFPTEILTPLFLSIKNEKTYKELKIGHKKSRTFKNTNSMKTLKYITNTFRSLRGTNAKTDNNTADNLELTNKRFGFNLKRTPTSGKVNSSLLSLLYAEENETLFI